MLAAVAAVAAAAAASLSAAAAAAVGVAVVGHVAGTGGPLGLVLHGEQLIAGCLLVGGWLLYTLCQRKARTCCCVKMVVMVIVQGREMSSWTKPLRNKSLSDSINNTAQTIKKQYNECGWNQFKGGHHPKTN